LIEEFEKCKFANALLFSSLFIHTMLTSIFYKPLSAFIKT